MGKSVIISVRGALVGPRRVEHDLGRLRGGFQEQAREFTASLAVGLPTGLGIQVNGYPICRISRRNLVFQLADFLRVLTLPLFLLARMSPSEKRRMVAMFLAPWPAR